MTTFQDVTRSVLAGGLLAMAAAALPAAAQTAQPAGAPAGAYVLAEAGPALTALARMTIAADGSVTGTELLRTSTAITTYAIQGTYTADAEGSGALAIHATSSDNTDSDGNPVTFSENLKVLAGAAGEFATLRTDPGIYTTGSLLSAATEVAGGSYLLNGKPVDPAATSVEVVHLDGAGNVSGREVLNSFGATTDMALTGSYLNQANGFQTLAIFSQGADADGNPVISTESYVFLPAQKEILMLRTDGGPSGIVTLLP